MAVDTRTGAPGHILSLTEKLQQFAGTTAQALQEKEAFREERQTKLDDAYRAGVKNDMRMALSKIANENTSDLNKFQALSKAYIDSVVSESNPRVKEDIALMADGLATSYAEKIQANEIDRNNKNAKLELDNNINISAQDAERLMREGDTLGAGEAILDAYESIDSQVVSGDLLPAQADKLKMQLSQGVAEQSFMTQIDDAATAEDAYDVIDGLSQKTPKGWAPDEWDTFLTKARRSVSSRLSIQKSERTAKNKQLKLDIKNAIEATDLGMDLPQREWDKLSEAALASGDPELIGLIQGGLKTIGFSRQSIEEQKAEIAALEKSGIESTSDYIALTKAFNKTQKEAEQDGMGLAVRQGLIEENLLQSPNDYMRAGVQSTALSEHYGVKVSPFTDNQASNLVTQLPEMNNIQKFELTQNINAMHPQARDAAYDQIMKKGGAMFAMVGAIGDRNLAEQAFMGADKLKAGIVKAPSQTDYLTGYNSFVGDVYGAEDSRAILDASIAIYANQYPDEEFSYSDFESIVEQVTGGIATYNGQKYQLPRGMAEGDFEDYIDDFSMDGFEALGGASGYSYDQFMETLDDGNLKSIGDNQYLIIDSKTEGVILQRSGEPFIFTFDPTYQAANKQRRRSR